MKISKNLILSLAIVLIASSSIYSAVFTVKNKSSKVMEASPNFGENTQAYSKINPGSEKSYNSGGDAVWGMKWREPDTKKNYEAHFQVHSYNIGGSFEIKNNGAYYYYFGIDGEKSGTIQPKLSA